MIGLEGALFKRCKLEVNEGSRAHLKGGRIEKCTAFDGRGLEGALDKNWGEGSKAHSSGGRIGNALPLMVEGSKAHSKVNEVRARRRTQKKVG